MICRPLTPPMVWKNKAMPARRSVESFGPGVVITALIWVERMIRAIVQKSNWPVEGWLIFSFWIIM